MTDDGLSSTTRRGVLATLGSVAVAGCSGFVSRDDPYQIVGGVEWTLIRGGRDGTNRKVAETQQYDAPVVDSAPTKLEVHTIAYDTAVIDLSGDGPIQLDDETVERLEGGYDDLYGVVVLTLYNDDPHSEVPKGNSSGYRVTLEELDQVRPGDRVSATVDTDRDVTAIDDLLTVDRADG